MRISAGALVAALPSARGQRQRISRVGVLDPGIPHLFAAFREAMRGLGYVEGRDVRFDIRSSHGKRDEIPRLAMELVALEPEIIVTAGTLPIDAARRATSTIPIVCVVGDAVGTGLATNLAKPAGNVTGLSFLNNEFSAKRIEVLKEAIPSISRVAMLADVTTNNGYATETLAAAQRLGVQVQQIDVGGTVDLAQAFHEAQRGRAEAVDVLASACPACLDRQACGAGRPDSK